MIKIQRNFFKEIHDKSNPVFVLSTGRCGTKFLTKVLKRSEVIDSFHEPVPELIYYSKYAYENQCENEKLKLIIDSSRFEYIMRSFLNKKIYFESNNRLTFFAYQLNELFPKAKFIHLIRDPRDFVRSGIRRKWYSGQHLWDMGRIKPLNDSINWDHLNLISKISWLWNETNSFIEDFKKSIDEEKMLTVKSEDLFTDINVIKKIFDFIDVPLVYDDQELAKLIEKPVNKQNVNQFPYYEDWNISQKISLKKYVKLANLYDYKF